ncbi:MAG: LysM peptidoglycan-binding domain-containing protein [Christensenellaceae bacterium]|nr:LysM peptidoglycan-binding domain-containing protein [Christensenellaceae bacterium]
MMETTTRAPQEKVCGYEYTVKRGDSFYLIAHRLGVPLRDLLEANADINPARLMVGDVLCIPMEEDDVPAPETQLPAQTPAEPEETAPEPDTPQVIPEPVVLPETIIEETEIIPETMPEDSLDMPAAEQSVQPAAHSCGGTRYTVSEGETAADIQLDTGLSFNTLQSANPTVSFDQLSAGEVLCIPEANIPCPTVSTYSMQAGETLESVALRLNVSLGALLRANPCLAPADFTEGMCIIVPD